MFDSISKKSLEIQGSFRPYDVSGTCVVLDAVNNERALVNPERALKRFSPASTFKVMHSLIALEEGVVTPDTVYAWDGSDQAFAGWKQDHSLRSAFKASCLWYYQRLTESIPEEVYHRYLETCSYGNSKIGDALHEFWLDESLQISAFEQVTFLHQLYERALPFSEESISNLLSIMEEDRFDDFTLYGKTGWYRCGERSYGWYVGMLLSGKQQFYVATNMDMPEGMPMSVRKEVTLSILSQLDIL